MKINLQILVERVGHQDTQMGVLSGNSKWTCGNPVASNWVVSFLKTKVVFQKALHQIKVCFPQACLPFFSTCHLWYKYPNQPFLVLSTSHYFCIYSQLSQEWYLPFACEFSGNKERIGIAFLAKIPLSQRTARDSCLKPSLLCLKCLSEAVAGGGVSSAHLSHFMKSQLRLQEHYLGISNICFGDSLCLSVAS